MLTDLRALLVRDLGRLAEEVEAYPDEESVWVVPGGMKNAAGTLVLHVVGNLNHYVGARLGGTGYVRDRPAEFSRRGVTRGELVGMVRETAGMVERVLGGPVEEGGEYPEEVFGERMTTGWFLIHLYGHLNWHRGQVNYHRKCLIQC